MLKPTSLTSVILLGTSLILTACGGGSSSSKDDPVKEIPVDLISVTKTGVFVDSPVANIAYSTENQSGFTNEDGEFQYETDETITFSIGGIDLPSAPAKSLITPYTLAEATTDPDDVVAINIARLLQTLDEDGDPDNGITIHNDAHTTADTMTAVDFSSSDFANNNQIINLIADSGSVTTTLVSEIDAQAHLDGGLTAFYEKVFVGRSFAVTSNDSDIQFTRLDINEGYTGQIHFTEANATTWEIVDNVLTVRETDDNDNYWDWVFEITSFTSTGDALVLTADTSFTASDETSGTGYKVTLTHRF